MKHIQISMIKPDYKSEDDLNVNPQERNSSFLGHITTRRGHFDQTHTLTAGRVLAKKSNLDFLLV